jgi:hypothetical protein
MPGTRSSSWPDGLESFVERQDSLDPLSFWNEPLDTLGYGVQFYDDGRSFVQKWIAKVKASTTDTEKELCNELGLGLIALLGYAVLSASNDSLLEVLSTIS